MELTKVERLILANQYRILDALDPEAEHGEELNILSHGFEGEYERLVGWILDPLPATACHRVLDILDMYAWLQSEAVRLGVVEAIPEQDLLFPGFDGNDEPQYMAFAEFLMEKQKRFTYVKVRRTDGGVDLNSHFPMLPRYDAMLGEMPTRSSERQELDEETVRTVLAKR